MIYHGTPLISECMTDVRNIVICPKAIARKFECKKLLESRANMTSECNLVSKARVLALEPVVLTGHQIQNENYYTVCKRLKSLLSRLCFVLGLRSFKLPQPEWKKCPPPLNLKAKNSRKNTPFLIFYIKYHWHFQTLK